MKIDLKQNSPEWYEFRSKHIGASDAPIILGVSKFCTRDELLLKKLGLAKEKETNDYILQKGHELEARARNLFELELGKSIEPVVFKSDYVSYLSASLDGLLDDGTIWEHKLVGRADLETVRSGKCLDKYFPQLQHQMYCAEAHQAILACSIDDKELGYQYAYVVVKRDDAYIRDTLLPALERFWLDLNAAKVDDAFVPQLYVDFSHDQNLVKLLDEYRELKGVEKKLKEVTEKIWDIVYMTGQCGSVKLTRSVSKPKLVPDYERMVAELQLDVSPFLVEKKGIETKRISFGKGKELD